eukprot:TRINITY_DN11639_c0_g1_i2.p1 TRINITY_DN11639_c0_g1~~TRINITY_DN11639_c0_g1_i2.p1  ORF type:complete len:187 (-),score=47.70 TRINITY_DN11639_c0_g1_i2:8-511(-)
MGGIPAAPFVDDVEKYLKGDSPDDALKVMQETYSKYKWLEERLLSRKGQLKAKVPDIKQALSMVTHLQEGKTQNIKAHFEVSTGIYAKASIEKQDKVCLWLGANVMVEYSYEEAHALLTKNLNAAETHLSNLETELNFLKDQITTTEVNIARVYNYNVKLRKANKKN